MAPRQRRGRNGADRGQREERRVDRQDRAMGGEVVGGAAGGRRDEDAVADQLFQPHLAVDRDPELGRLVRLAQQRDLVEGERLVRLRRLVGRRHPQRLDRRRSAGARRSSSASRCSRSSGSRPSRGSCRRSACRDDMKRCSVCSMRPSPPSATMTSAVLGRRLAIGLIRR